jgi:hypothetical protein
VAAFAEVLELSSAPSVTADFFVDLGGDSLSAALAVSTLQDDPAAAALTVRDLYDHPSAGDLAALAAEPIVESGDGPRARAATASGATPGRSNAVPERVAVHGLRTRVTASRT